jgi:hypothetical protein
MVDVIPSALSYGRGFLSLFPLAGGLAISLPSAFVARSIQPLRQVGVEQIISF